MKTLDTLLQHWRIRKAVPWLAGARRVIDIGTHDGTLFDYLPGVEGVGLDPKLAVTRPSAGLDDRVRFIEGMFPADLPDAEPFDAIVMLAVLEHVPREDQARLAADCHRHLQPNGTVVITTPSPLVDPILDVLIALRLIDAMGDTHHEHYGFEPAETIDLFTGAGFELVARRRFQLGLNHLFVFRRGSVEPGAQGASE